MGRRRLLRGDDGGLGLAFGESEHPGEIHAEVAVALTPLALQDRDPACALLCQCNRSDQGIGRGGRREAGKVGIRGQSGLTEHRALARRADDVLCLQLLQHTKQR